MHLPPLPEHYDEAEAAGLNVADLAEREPLPPAQPDTMAPIAAKAPPPDMPGYHGLPKREQAPPLRTRPR